MDHGYRIFDTALGRCALAWRGGAVVATALPAPEAALRLAVERRAPGAPEGGPGSAPPPVAAAIAGIVALLAGERASLDAVAVAFGDASPFERRVWALARTIPPGETLTYGAVADRLGESGAARAVGVALGRNPVPIVVPCHRVLAASGRSGGFSAPGGIDTKMRLLSIEARHAAPDGLFGTLPLQAPPRRRAG